MLKRILLALIVCVGFEHSCFGQDDGSHKLAKRLTKSARAKHDPEAVLKFKYDLMDADDEQVRLKQHDAEDVVKAILDFQRNRKGERMIVALADYQKIIYDNLVLLKKHEERPLCYATFEADKDLRVIPLMKALMDAGASPTHVEHFNDGYYGDEEYAMPLIKYWKREAQEDFVESGYNLNDFDKALQEVSAEPAGVFDVPDSMSIYEALSEGTKPVQKSTLSKELGWSAKKKKGSKEMSITAALRKKEVDEGKHVCICDYCGNRFK